MLNFCLIVASICLVASRSTPSSSMWTDRDDALDSYFSICATDGDMPSLPSAIRGVWSANPEWPSFYPASSKPYPDAPWITSAHSLLPFCACYYEFFIFYITLESFESYFNISLYCIAILILISLYQIYIIFPVKEMKSSNIFLPNFFLRVIFLCM